MYLIFLRVLLTAASCAIIVLAKDVLLSRRSSNEVCSSIFATTAALNKAERSFIFRCRPGDDCGGVGDRLAGVMGGAFYAMQTGRTFRVHWPGLESVFKPGVTNWTYSSSDFRIDDFNAPKIVNANGNEIFPLKIGHRSANQEVGVVNDLNSRQIMNSTVWPEIEKYKHVFFHSNRGPNMEMYNALSAKYNWTKVSENEDENYFEAYRCVFAGMFRLTDAFLSSFYKPIGKSPVHFSHIVRSAEDRSFQLMAFHFRVSDGWAESDDKQHIIDDATMTRIVTLAEKHKREGAKMNLFFITNSNCSAHKVIADENIRKTFHAVYSQELTASIHVNYIKNKAGQMDDSSEATVLSMRQTMRDWWIMRLADVLVLQTSGFSKSAALMAPLSQIRYEDGGESLRPVPWIMCGGRFC